MFYSKKGTNPQTRKKFYLNLNKLMNYGTAPNFPSEAHQIERILPIIFTSLGEVNPWMEDEKLFDKNFLSAVHIFNISMKTGRDGLKKSFGKC